MDDSTISFLLEREAQIYPAKNAAFVVPQRPGYYSIFIDEPARFPAPFDLLLHQRSINLIYIGINTRLNRKLVHVYIFGIEKLVK